jgi:hypothetical protein
MKQAQRRAGWCSAALRVAVRTYLSATRCGWSCGHSLWSQRQDARGIRMVMTFYLHKALAIALSKGHLMQARLRTEYNSAHLKLNL